MVYNLQNTLIQKSDGVRILLCALEPQCLTDVQKDIEREMTRAVNSTCHLNENECLFTGLQFQL